MKQVAIHVCQITVEPATVLYTHMDIMCRLIMSSNKFHNIGGDIELSGELPNEYRPFRRVSVQWDIAGCRGMLLDLRRNAAEYFGR